MPLHPVPKTPGSGSVWGAARMTSVREERKCHHPHPTGKDRGSGSRVAVHSPRGLLPSPGGAPPHPANPWFQPRVPPPVALTGAMFICPVPQNAGVKRVD